MEEKINIAKILKNKPEGTKLWTDMFGSVTLYVVTNACDAFQVKHHNKEPWFDEDGKLYKEGVLCIYPSKSMRDWAKFSWKKGDVLVSKDNVYIIFEKFEDDTYTRFKGKHYLWKECNVEDYNKEETKMLTSVFEKATDDVAQTYIKTIEEHLDGKLNLETLEIEKQLEFKDGDIVVYGKSVAICRRIYKHTLSFYVSLTEMFGLLFADEVESSEEYRFATEEEKQQLFDALEKEGKAWDAEKKQIVDIKKELQFKPFEKVLVRDSIDDVWRASFFSHIKEDDGRYVTTGLCWKFCIPYEGNEHLLGTTDNFE
ncbi:hypothetical protein [Segatella copri]|uniref:Uncharacterized protein n=1 Tax=Segatella copri TaxID=165179 RepID=A0A414Y5H9_9BACT|nr:hypothetical protein [Segatella copri]RHH81422.1 hypothetical protein DW192_10195 [Segatella copri]